jgi:hypothetical protein
VPVPRPAPTTMDVQLLPLTALTPDPQNPRITDAAVGAVAESIRRYGFRQPIVVTAEHRIIAGHTRYLAAQRLGLTHVPVHVARDLSEDEARAYQLADNKTHELARWDRDALRALLRTARLTDVPGFNPATLRTLLALKRTDELPAGRQAPRRTAPGESWRLGRHRLIVGDSRRVQLREEVAIVVFDPPFDMDYGAWHLPPAPVVAVFGRGDQRLRWEAATMLSQGYKVHELVLSGGVRGQHRDTLPCCVHDTIHVWRRRADPFDQTVLAACNWPLTRDGRPYSVRTHTGGVLTGWMSWGKPLVVMELLMAYVPRDSIVYDPCAGSGTSVLAAERHGRIAIAYEVQPRWADLTIWRWERETGQTAVREGTDAPVGRRASSRVRSGSRRIA